MNTMLPIGSFYVVIRTKAKQISGPRQNTPYDIEEIFSNTRTFVMRVINMSFAQGAVPDQ